MKSYYFLFVYILIILSLTSVSLRKASRFRTNTKDLQAVRNKWFKQIGFSCHTSAALNAEYMSKGRVSKNFLFDWIRLLQGYVQSRNFSGTLATTNFKRIYSTKIDENLNNGIAVYELNSGSGTLHMTAFFKEGTTIYHVDTNQSSSTNGVTTVTEVRPTSGETYNILDATNDSFWDGADADSIHNIISLVAAPSSSSDRAGALKSSLTTALDGLAALNFFTTQQKEFFNNVKRSLGRRRHRRRRNHRRRNHRRTN